MQERISIIALVFFLLMFSAAIYFLSQHLSPVSYSYPSEIKSIQSESNVSLQKALNLRRNKFFYSPLEMQLRKSGLINVQDSLPEVFVSLKYSTQDNFMKKDMYGTLIHCYLHPDVITSLKKVLIELKKKRNDLSLLIYDGARPRSVQQMMWDTISKDPKLVKYVSDPSNFSPHNYGLAIDLTLCDSAGNPLDMGTPYDFFGAEAHITKEKELVTAKKISSIAYENRWLLREAMTRAGFQTISSEWWHFSYPANQCKTNVLLIP